MVFRSMVSAGDLLLTLPLILGRVITLRYYLSIGVGVVSGKQEAGPTLPPIKLSPITPLLPLGLVPCLISLAL